MFKRYFRPVRKFLGRIKRGLEDWLENRRKGFYWLMSTPLRVLPGGPEAGIAYLTGQRPLTPELVIMAYSQGMFQLGNECGQVIWECPSTRAVIFMENYHIPRRLRRDIRKCRREHVFEVHFDTAFEEVIRNCACRETTWITEPIIQTWLELHEMGLAHSAETWQNGELVGGSYGLSLGSYYAGESMFYKVDDASKVAFVALMDELKRAGITMIDIQFLTTLFLRFGAVEIPRDEYYRHLARALVAPIRLALPEVYEMECEPEMADALAF